MYKYATILSGKKLIAVTVAIALTIGFGFAQMLNAELVLLSLVLAYFIVRRLLLPGVFEGKIIVGLVAIFIYAITLQSTILAAWCIDRNFPVTLGIPINTILLLLIIVAQIHFEPETLPRNTKSIWHIKYDIAALVVVIFALVFVSTPLISKINNLHKSDVLNFVNNSIDDGHHIEFVNDRLEFNRGIIYDSSAEKNVRNVGEISTYPAGWYAANGAIVKAFIPKITIGRQSLVLYVISKLFWYIILVFVFAKTCFSLLHMLVEKKVGNRLLAWMMGCEIMFAFFFLIAPFRLGFYSFIPQLIAVLLLGLTLMQLSFVKGQEAISISRTAALSTILAVGGGLSWFLLLPALCIAVLITVGAKIGSLRELPKRFLIIIRPYWLLYLLIFASTVVQLYVTLTAQATQPFVSHVDTQGPIEVYSGAFYGCIAIGLLLLFIFLRRSKVKIATPYLVLTVCLLGLAACIGAIQTYHQYYYGYYYFKVLDAFTMTAIPLAIVGYGSALHHIYKNKSRTIAYLSALSLLFAIFQFVGPNPGYPNGLIGASHTGIGASEEVSYFKGVRALTPQMNQDVWSELSRSARLSKKHTLIYYFPQQTSSSEIATLLAETNQPYSQCADVVSSNIHNSANASQLVGYIRHACKNVKVTIVTTSNYTGDTAEAINNAGLSSRVAVRQLD